MAFRPLLRQARKSDAVRWAPIDKLQRAVVPAVAFSAALMFAPRTAHAEERLADAIVRKPIYDDLPLDTTAPTLPQQSNPNATEESYRPTPTDRLAVYIGHVRLVLHKQAVRSEEAVDRALTETLRLEHSFTSTIRSLAPPRESGERIFPGALYVLVGTMAGSIITRNRNILLRASVPAIVGIAAAKFVLPKTTKNVGDLIWTYEERYPALADAHVQARERISHFYETGKAHAGMTVGMVQDKLSDTREGVEGWVRKGR